MSIDGREEALKLLTETLRDRGSNHGDALTNFANVRDLWTWWLRSRCLLVDGAHLDSKDVAQMMVLFKLARSSRDIEHTDSILDEAGYAILAVGIDIATETSCAASANENHGQKEKC